MRDYIRLDNGLRIIGERLEWARSFTLGIWVDCGSRHEAVNEGGMSHFVEHMLFKGTHKTSARDISWRADAMGAQLDAFTTKEYTCYYITAVSERLNDAAELLLELLTDSRFDPDELERERGVILEEIAMNEDSPDEVALDMLDAATFGAVPLGRPILGPADNVRGFTAGALADYKRRMYTPDAMVIAVSGNYDWDALVALVADRLGGLGGARQPDALQPFHSFEFGHVRAEKGLEQTQLCLSFGGVGLGAEDRYIQSVLTNLLGGFMSSRLSQRVREELGLAYTIYASPTLYRDCGEITIYAAAQPERAQRVIDAVADELRSLRTGGADRALFELARSQLKAEYILDMEGQYTRMEELGISLLLTGHAQNEDGVTARIDAVTLDQVNTFARTALGGRFGAALYGMGVGGLDLSALYN